STTAGPPSAGPTGRSSRQKTGVGVKPPTSSKYTGRTERGSGATPAGADGGGSDVVAVPAGVVAVVRAATISTACSGEAKPYTSLWRSWKRATRPSTQSPVCGSAGTASSY